jgi:hypothetical protein
MRLENLSIVIVVQDMKNSGESQIEALNWLNTMLPLHSTDSQYRIL